MDFWAFVADEISAAGLLIGFVVGALLSWVARGDWDAVCEVNDDDERR